MSHTAPSAWGWNAPDGGEVWQAALRDYPFPLPARMRMWLLWCVPVIGLAAAWLWRGRSLG